MDWLAFGLSQALFVVDQVLRNPAKRQKYREKMLLIASLITAAYSDEERAAFDPQARKAQ